VPSGPSLRPSDLPVSAHSGRRRLRGQRHTPQAHPIGCLGVHFMVSPDLDVPSSETVCSAFE